MSRLNHSHKTIQRQRSSENLQEKVNVSSQEENEESVVSNVMSTTKRVFDDVTEEVKRAGVKLKYFAYHELPIHLRDNKDILTGYRAYYTFSQCCQSIFTLHNETGNIWTHLIGALFFTGSLYFALSGLPDHAGFMDYMMMSTFLFSAILCLLCSTIFHTFSAHNHPLVYSAMAALDYSGISLLIFGSFAVATNYMLYCFVWWRTFYLACMIICCIVGLIVSWIPSFKAPKYRLLRAVFFVSYGCIAATGIFHSIHLNGWEFTREHINLEYLVLEVFLYLLGACIYAARIPESWFPGRLDHWFHSHQVWHVLVVSAAYCHYRAAVPLIHFCLSNDTCSYIMASHSKAPHSFGLFSLLESIFSF